MGPEASSSSRFNDLPALRPDPGHGALRKKKTFHFIVAVWADVTSLLDI